MSSAHDLTAVFGDLISAYTRAQAIADGVLLDVSDRAQRFDIRFPVALTAGVYGAPAASVRKFTLRTGFEGFLQ
ncbi:MAG: hypothetical protein M3Y72_03895 [Acidobacteriota bacterium]|nr:hypothetical protein [Acidobacteriota bacterium]